MNRITLLFLGCLFVGLCPWVSAQEATGSESPGLVSCFKSVRKVGLESYETEECKKAVEIFQKAIGEHPEEVGNYIALGRCYGFMLQFEEAIKYNEQAMTIAPNDWNPHMEKAMNLVALKRYREAKPEFRKALELLNSQGGKLKDIQIVEEMMNKFDR